MGRIKQSSTHRRNRSSLAVQAICRASPTPQLRTTLKAKHHSRHRHRRRRPLREADRQQLAEVAQDTLSIIYGEGSYTDMESGLTHDISYQVKSSIAKTCVYASSSTGFIDNWRDGPRLQTLPPGHEIQIKFVQTSPLRGARDLVQFLQDSGDEGVGFLNCSSAKRPGGGFLNGGTEQEECLARASTLHASLASSAAAPFYRAHKHDDAAGFYDHQLIFTPHVVVIRSDRRPCDGIETGGGPFIAPFYLSVVSSCAINVQQLRGFQHRDTNQNEMNQGIEDVMRSRMARILRVFEERGIKNLLLGGFGTGQPFYNKVETVARIWAELLLCPGAVFKRVFDRIWFAVEMPQFQTFKAAFETRVLEEELTVALQDEDPASELKFDHRQPESSLS